MDVLVARHKLGRDRNARRCLDLVATFAGNVDEALQAAGVNVGGEDLVYPAPSEEVRTVMLSPSATFSEGAG